MIFAFRFRRPDNGELMQCNCALVETLWPYGSPKGKSSRKSWWQSTAQIGTKLLYLPSEDTDKVVYVVPLCDILGKLPLVPAGATGTIPNSAKDQRDTHFPLGKSDSAGKPGSGSGLFYINSWAMTWPTDHQEQSAYAEMPTCDGDVDGGDPPPGQSEDQEAETLDFGVMEEADA